MEKTNKDRKSILVKLGVMTVAIFCVMGFALLPGSRVRQVQHKNVIELVVYQSTFLNTGKSTIDAKGIFVTHVHGLPGYAQAVEVVFLPRPFTEEDQSDILKDNWKKTKGSTHALLVLCLDKGWKLSQAILACVVPGTTVSRSVAWKPEDLKKYFSDYKCDGKTLILKSKGSYAETGKEDLRFSWTLDVNLPVIGDIKW